MLYDQLTVISPLKLHTLEIKNNGLFPFGKQPVWLCNYSADSAAIAS